ncbi:MAG: prepilin-type N-terminal cleavage/methylation domain-containing protein [Alphaproteobacteria bacterium]
MKNFKRQAFSLIELSIVILIIGILVAGVTQSSRLVRQIKLYSAQSITRSSDINSIGEMVFWAETTLEKSLTNAQGSSDVEDGNAISSWSDINLRSNPKINLAQSNTNNQPAYKLSGINGLPSISFDGNNDNLFSTSITPLPPADKNYTLVLVWRPSRLTSADGVILLAQGTSPFAPNRVASILLYGGTSGFAGWFNSYYSATQVAINVDYITIITINNNLASNNVAIYINSNTPSLGTSSGGPANLDLSNQIFCVGGVDSMASMYNFFGLISEAIVFDRNLKADEVRAVNSYLSKKYAIKIN